MIFLYSSLAGESEISLQKGEENFLYLSKVKRYGVGENILLSNLEDNILYEYVFSEITKKEIILTKNPDKKSEQKLGINADTKLNLHLLWGICDPKTIYKTLPFLNELGVSQLTFVECDRTQGNFLKQIQKNILPNEKIQKILEQSCQQCGRNSRMSISCDSLQNILEKYTEKLENKSGRNLGNKNLYICDFPSKNKFSDIILHSSRDIENRENKILVGPEGGFSAEEKKYFSEFFPENIFQFSGNTVMRSETAIISVAGKFLL